MDALEAEKEAWASSLEGRIGLTNGYRSRSNDILVPSGGETVYLYAFGYDSDRGRTC